MAMPASAHTYWTPAAVLAEFPESNHTRHECVDGELLVSPVPRVAHELVVTELCALFVECVGRRRALRALADLRLTADSLVQPDVFVLEHALVGRAQWAEVPRPLVIIEVLSPSTALADRGRKRRLYQRSGVPEYWIVDFDARCIERWTPEAYSPDVRRNRIAWTDPVSGATVDIDLPAFFASV